MAIKDLLLRIRGDSSQLDKETKKTQGILGGFKKVVASIGGAIAGAFAVQSLIRFGFEAAKLAAEAEGIKTAFDQLNRPDLLRNLQIATRGTVDNVKLMQAAVKAENFKVPLGKLATFFEFATKRAIQTGESVDYLVESIINGIGRKSSLVLDNLGISATELQEEIKKVGDFGMAAGNIIERELGKMGDVADTSSIAISRLATEWKNFKTEAGKGLAPAALTVIEVLKNSVKNLGTLLGSSTKRKYKQGIDEILESNREFLKSIDEENKKLKEVDNAEKKRIITLNDLAQQLEDLTEIQKSTGLAEIGSINRQIEAVNSLIKKYKEAGLVRQGTLIDSLDSKKPDQIPTESKQGSLVDNKFAEDEAAKMQSLAMDMQLVIDLYPEIELGGVDSFKALEEAVDAFQYRLDQIPNSLMRIRESMMQNLDPGQIAFMSLENAATQFGDAVMQAGINSEGSLADFAQNVQEAARKIIAAQLAEGVSAAVAGALVNVPFPFNLAAAGVAGGAAAALFNAIPSFAEGGMVSKPTLAMIGDAKDGRPEYIFNSSQMDKMMNIQVNGILRGKDIYLSAERESKSLKLNTGGL